MSGNRLSDINISFEWISKNGISVALLSFWLETFGNLLPSPLSKRIEVRKYAQKLNDLGIIGVAKCENEVVGFVSLYANDQVTKTSHITVIGVLPNYQGLGIGKVILSRAIAMARKKGMNWLTLEVDAENKVARAVYEKAGMKIRREEKGKLLMELNLVVPAARAKEIETQIDSGDRLAASFELDIQLRIKRDDLFPIAGGGIKARKIKWIWRDVISGGHDVVVTTGGPQSNHARASALLAAESGIKCHLVISVEEKKNYPNTGNILLMQLCGAKIEYCHKDEISSRMDQAMTKYQNKGHNPIYIWGGGHCNSGTDAFVDATIEAQRQCMDWIPDFVVLASGTGSTQAGLIIGYAGLPTRVIGISVARERKRGSEVIRKCLDDYAKERSLKILDCEIDFRDNWTFGGYEKTDKELIDLVVLAGKQGIHVDPTYSGKGLYGLVELVKTGVIPKKSKVLFWHTGGLMNLIASQLAVGNIHY